MSERGFDLVVLSPHLDDGALSCGGRLAACAAAGGRAVLVTLFAGDDPADPANPLAVELRRLWDLPPGRVVAARRREDREACRRLGVAALHWRHPEALYRTAAAGEPLYPTIAALYGEPADAEAALVGELAAAIADLPPAGLLLAPLGVGGHVDHRLARRAAEASGREIAFYEEFPYVEWKRFALGRALGLTPPWPLVAPRGWRAETLPLDDSQLDRRAEAILAYVSQVPALFRSEGRLRKQLRRAARRAGGERIWRRSTAAAGPG
jgi:LmbE family N-acetylglucosaminyl deacetylase